MHANRLLIVEWDGATLALLERLAEAGVLPHWARLRQQSTLARLPWCGLGSPTAAWTTLRSGQGPEHHGVWDESRLDAARRRVVPIAEPAFPSPALSETLPQAAPAARLVLCDRNEASAVWNRKPSSLSELTTAVERSEAVLDSLVARARQAALRDWQVLEVRVQTLAMLQHRLWHLLAAEATGSGCPWAAAAHRVFRALDHSLGQLLEVADAQGATLAVASPYGFVPFREKITVVELLRQRGLLALAGGSAKLAYGTRRWLWRVVRRLHPRSSVNPQGVHAPVKSLLPIDWRHSRAVSLHGQHAALVYLNTPERFGTRVLTTAAARDDALAETVAALREARHPVTGESLFAEVFSNSMLTSDAPDVIAIPASGFLVRHKPDHRRHLLRSDPDLTAVQGDEGLLLIRGHGPAFRDGDCLPLVAAAPTLLAAAAGESKPRG